ncbi:GDP-mannose 4,6 dehydratase [Psychrobacillus glaciei]|uniref:GDP-mannose 4,6 dehydratase n=1 Tax=Psychrobacillus glaciei TaxID=2283160 RepID=A0A5J6SJ23_9BACI|nr:GDP-mannose 4,6-dehydratase [Psychrobacillus glaciei]QFF97986.1 GDP-mannose 4,6 dehydratase [Psychrobacillus glaciei]
MRALITGVMGFVGKYLAEHLLSQGIEVWGTSRMESPLLRLKNGNLKIVQNNLDSTDDIHNLLCSIKPNYIFHLAGQSNVKLSWEDKEGTFYANVNKTIFLLDACVKYQQENPRMRILTVGSSEEYGKVESSELPIKETTILRPMSPYGASKAAVSMLIQQYHKAHGLNVIHVRPFNHIGPGQSLGFVVPDFTKQLVQIEKGEKEKVLKVGNLSAMRDFTDVRDIVEGYYELVLYGKLGEIYNICSGDGVSINEILNKLIELSSSNAIVEVCESKIRPIDIPNYIGENSKIKSDTDWIPKYEIIRTLEDSLNEGRSRK